MLSNNISSKSNLNEGTPAENITNNLLQILNKVRMYDQIITSHFNVFSTPNSKGEKAYAHYARINFLL